MGAPGRFRFDHVIMRVADLNAAAERLLTQHGLAAIEGGRHVGLGTGNMIVPFGDDYLELMAVVDPAEARSSELAAWVTSGLSAGDGLGALCLRTDEIEPWARVLGEEPLPMSRARPDGTLLSWRLAGLAKMFARPPHPFLICWDVPPESHPARTPAPHRCNPIGISWVELSGAPDDVRELFGGQDLDFRFTDGPPGVAAMGIATTEGEIVLT